MEIFTSTSLTAKKLNFWPLQNHLTKWRIIKQSGHSAHWIVWGSMAYALGISRDWKNEQPSTVYIWRNSFQPPGRNSVLSNLNKQAYPKFWFLFEKKFNFYKMRFLRRSSHSFFLSRLPDVTTRLLPSFCFEPSPNIWPDQKCFLAFHFAKFLSPI